MEIQEYVEQFHADGAGVFGLHPVIGGKCSCEREDCPTAGKHPLLGGWSSIPTPWSDDQFEVMKMIGHFKTGYGVLCKNAYLVLDIDPRNGGAVSYARLLERVPEVAGAGMIVKTGRGDGGMHIYFRAPVGVALLAHMRDYPGIDARHGNSFVVGPGSLHVSGGVYEAVVGTPEDIEPAPAGLIELLRRPATVRIEYNGAAMDVSQTDVASMLDAIPNNDLDYDTFIQIGMSVHHSTGGSGFDLWDQWARRSPKYDDSQMQYWFMNFGKHPNPVTVGTLIHHAEKNGWQRPVEFTGDTPVKDDDALPCSIDSVDLLRPPGRVGLIKAAIDAQCRYPRENLSTAAALYAAGNIAGLKYTDDLDGVTTNMFFFGVAASASGKEAVLQAVSEIHREVGISAATHGKQKSEQEVIRNHTRHQAAFYLIDELGIELGKAIGAQKRGGAIYLEGLFGALMSLYSKANGFYLISGDLKEAIRAELAKELAQCNKKLDENDDTGGFYARRVLSIEFHLRNLDKGIDRPFLSVMGFTTPETFDKLMDHDQATSGFLGRAIVSREKESNPRPKKGFKKEKLPEKLVGLLQSVYDAGEYDAFRDKVEYYGDRKVIPTDPAAATLLADIIDWIMDYAEKHKEKTGLEAVVRRSYELIAKISLTLAVYDGVRTVEHVRWAFSYVKNDIDQKMRLVMSNDASYGLDAQLMADITKHIDTEHGETFGVIKNRLRKYKSDDVKKAIELMVERDVLECRKSKHPTNGREFERFYFRG